MRKLYRAITRLLGIRSQAEETVAWRARTAEKMFKLGYFREAK